jgi:hypothetical protein
MQRLQDDPTLCARLGANAQRTAADYRAATVVSRIEAIYTTLLGATDV